MLPKGHQSHQFVCRNLGESTKISPSRQKCPARPYPPSSAVPSSSPVATEEAQ